MSYKNPKRLIRALKLIANATSIVYDEGENSMVEVAMDEDEMANIARGALREWDEGCEHREISHVCLDTQQRADITKLRDILTEVRDACLFDDDDGQIGVTNEPSIDDDLFNRICAAIRDTGKLNLDHEEMK